MTVKIVLEDCGGWFNDFVVTEGESEKIYSSAKKIPKKQRTKFISQIAHKGRLNPMEAKILLELARDFAT